MLWQYINLAKKLRAKYNMVNKAVIVISTALVSGCANLGNHNPNAGRYHLKHDKAPKANLSYEKALKIPDAIPKAEPKSRYGNPKSYVVFNKRYNVLNHNYNFMETGTASWYGTKFHGFRTSSGEPYDMYKMTAAHKTLPLPSYVEVTNLDNNSKVIVKVNDRGPFHGNRIIDLSYAAAIKLGYHDKGTARVRIRSLDPKAFKNNKPGKFDELRQQKSTTLALDFEEQEKSIYQFLQLGAFSNKTNADNLAARLKTRAMGNPVEIMEAHDSNNKVLYRVRLGPIAEFSKLKELKEQLKEQDFPQAIMLP